MPMKGLASGVPTPMNPPIINVAPSGISATASVIEMVFMIWFPAGASSDGVIGSMFDLNQWALSRGCTTIAG
jgi:hypothetical protein